MRNEVKMRMSETALGSSITAREGRRGALSAARFIAVVLVSALLPLQTVVGELPNPKPAGGSREGSDNGLKYQAHMQSIHRGPNGQNNDNAALDDLTKLNQEAGERNKRGYGTTVVPAPPGLDKVSGNPAVNPDGTVNQANLKELNDFMRALSDGKELTFTDPMKGTYGKIQYSGQNTLMMYAYSMDTGAPRPFTWKNRWGEPVKWSVQRRKGTGERYVTDESGREVYPMTGTDASGNSWDGAKDFQYQDGNINALSEQLNILDQAVANLAENPQDPKMIAAAKEAWAAFQAFVVENYNMNLEKNKKDYGNSRGGKPIRFGKSREDPAK